MAESGVTNRSANSKKQTKKADLSPQEQIRLLEERIEKLEKDNQKLRKEIIEKVAKSTRLRYLIYDSSLIALVIVVISTFSFALSFALKQTNQTVPNLPLDGNLRTPWDTNELETWQRYWDWNAFQRFINSTKLNELVFSFK